MKKKKNQGVIKQLIADLKAYLTVQSDYYQVLLVEKITKIIAIFVLSILITGFSLGLFFFLLFALAYYLIPILGAVASFAIVGGLFLLLIFIVILLRKAIIINPLLRAIVKAIENKRNNKSGKEEEYADTE